VTLAWALRQDVCVRHDFFFVEILGQNSRQPAVPTERGKLPLGRDMSQDFDGQDGNAPVSTRWIAARLVDRCGCYRPRWPSILCLGSGRDLLMNKERRALTPLRLI